jgi:hypothetical protein
MTELDFITNVIKWIKILLISLIIFGLLIIYLGIING